MNIRTIVSLRVASAAGGAYTLGRRRSAAQPLSASTAEQDYQRLAQAAPLLRVPTAPDQVPEVLADGSGLRCSVTGKVYPYRQGVLDLLAGQVALTETQQALDTRLTAWAYDRFRGALMRLFNLPTFPAEVAAIQQVLQVEPGDTVLDLACGHGNFTVEWAKRVGPRGLVIGLDLSPAMLARAAAQVQAWGLSNVLLVRGDALRLPLGDQGLVKINCSGGFHQFPDLDQALRELARVSQPGAVLTASTFAMRPADRSAPLKRWLEVRFDLRFVPLAELGPKLAALGYEAYRWSLPGRAFGYLTARKTHARPHAASTTSAR